MNGFCVQLVTRQFRYSTHAVIHHWNRINDHRIKAEEEEEAAFIQEWKAVGEKWN